jgi:hypothetical protein
MKKFREEATRMKLENSRGSSGTKKHRFALRLALRKVNTEKTKPKQKLSISKFVSLSKHHGQFISKIQSPVLETLPETVL